MAETISKQQAIEQIKNYFHNHIDNSMYECDAVDCCVEIVRIVEKIDVGGNNETNNI